MDKVVQKKENFNLFRTLGNWVIKPLTIISSIGFLGVAYNKFMNTKDPYSYEDKNFSNSKPSEYVINNRELNLYQQSVSSGIDTSEEIARYVMLKNNQANFKKNIIGSLMVFLSIALPILIFKVGRSILNSEFKKKISSFLGEDIDSYLQLLLNLEETYKRDKRIRQDIIKKQKQFFNQIKFDKYIETPKDNKIFVIKNLLELHFFYNYIFKSYEKTDSELINTEIINLLKSKLT
jgi:hypothetical protein